jgi:two-component system, cell cycle response regulator
MGEVKRLSSQEVVMLFNYATRLIAIEPNLETIYERSLEALSILSGNRRAALYTLEKETGALRLEGVFADTAYQAVKIKVPYRRTPFESVMSQKQYAIFPVSRDPLSGYPLPTYDPCPQGDSSLCLPMAGTSNDIIGVVTIDRNPDQDWSALDIQVFISLTTVVAIAIENSRLYKLATIDGLTRLFVRSFFELRLQEEVARLKRNGGVLSVLLADIDSFKKINDSCGHLHGDMVLREFAAILAANVRKGVDIPSRFGGDEFVVLIIGAGPQGAISLAERIRRHCESHLFSFEGKSVHVTMSGGLSIMDAGDIRDEQDLIRKADQMLYRAKGLGGNKVCSWEDAP